MTNQTIKDLAIITERNDKAEAEYHRATEELHDFLSELYVNEVDNLSIYRKRAIENLQALTKEAQELTEHLYQTMRDFETHLTKDNIEQRS